MTYGHCPAGAARGTMKNVYSAFGSIAMSLLVVGCGSSTEPAPEGTGTPSEATSTAPTGTTAGSDSTVTDGTSTNATPVDQAKPVDPEAVKPGEPLVGLPKDEWTWVDVPGSACGNGSETGFAVNLTDKSKDVMIFLEGGGACWSGTSCYGGAGVLGTATYFSTGYGDLAFKTDPQRSFYFLQRGNDSNPFKDKNLVFVPYCSGDAYSGDNVTTLEFLGQKHETHFKGYKNMGLFLSRLVATFGDAKRVWLAGDSAGGFGAALSFGRVQATFTGARVDAIDDSGQPIAPDPERWESFKKAWNMHLPADCANCGDGPGAFVDYYRQKFPTNRFALISYEHDAVIAPFMNLSYGDFNKNLHGLMDHMDKTWSNGHYYVMNGFSHVGLTLPSNDLKDWIYAMVNDDPTWKSVKP